MAEKPAVGGSCSDGELRTQIVLKVLDEGLKLRVIRRSQEKHDKNPSSKKCANICDILSFLSVFV